MAEFRADLHCHSFFSDGSDSPEKLIDLAKEAELSGLSITDHDTIEAYRNIFPYAEKIQIRLLVGAEFSAFYRNEAVHILGYAFSLKSPKIHELCERHKVRREKRNLKILENLRKFGIVIQQEELYSNGYARTIGRPKIGEILVQKGCVATVKEAFDQYLAEGKKAYDPGEHISVQETLDVIHAAGGLAIIAHPHLIKRQRVLRDLLTMKFDGLEGYYARFEPQAEKKWIELAKNRKWIVTGGSDYHGKNKPQNIFASSWVNQETFDKLYNHYVNLSSFS